MTSSTASGWGIEHDLFYIPAAEFKTSMIEDYDGVSHVEITEAIKRWQTKLNDANVALIGNVAVESQFLYAFGTNRRGREIIDDPMRFEGKFASYVALPLENVPTNNNYYSLGICVLPESIDYAALFVPIAGSDITITS